MTQEEKDLLRQDFLSLTKEQIISLDKVLYKEELKIKEMIKEFNENVMLLHYHADVKDINYLDLNCRIFEEYI